MHTLRRDPRFLFFAAGAALALIISAPFTFAIVAPFHQGGEPLTPGWWVGGLLSAGLVVLLEAGAVGAKIAGVRWLALALLALTFIGNLVTGSDYWQRAILDGQPMLAGWRASWFGWLPPVLYAAIVPVLLYTFLHFAIERAEQVLRGSPRTVEGEVAELRRDVRSVAAAVVELAEGQRKMLALPEQASYPRPEEVRTQPVPAPDFECDGCGHQATPHQRRGYAQHGAWVCKNCGKRHGRQ
jgi:hypothetical protein